MIFIQNTDKTYSAKILEEIKKIPFLKRDKHVLNYVLDLVDDESIDIDELMDLFPDDIDIDDEPDYNWIINLGMIEEIKKSFREHGFEYKGKTLEGISIFEKIQREKED